MDFAAVLPSRALLNGRLLFVTSIFTAEMYAFETAVAEELIKNNSEPDNYAISSDS